MPRSIDEHLDHAEDLHRRMLDVFAGIAVITAALYIIVSCGC